MNDIINSFSEDSKEPLTTVQPASTVDEINYIVSKSSLLELFKQWPSCHNECIGEVAYQKDAFIAVKQLCSHCGHKRTWSSQPHIPTSRIHQQETSYFMQQYFSVELHLERFFICYITCKLLPLVTGHSTIIKAVTFSLSTEQGAMEFCWQFHHW